MKVILKQTECIAIKEPGDKRFTHGSWGSAESWLLYKIKQQLNKLGLDLIKKRMWKDGHLVDDDQLYLRSRKNTSDAIAIYNSQYAIEDAGDTFNKQGSVSLRVVH